MKTLPGVRVTRKRLSDALDRCGFIDRFNEHCDREDLPGVLDAEVLVDLRGPRTRRMLVRGDLQTNALVLPKGSPCLIVLGSVRAKRVEQADAAGSLLVLGDMRVGTLETEGEILVEGSLVADEEIVARASNRQLHVFGRVEAPLVVAERGHLLHFLGGGTIGVLRDEEGGRDLIRELGKVAEKIAVKRYAA